MVTSSMDKAAAYSKQSGEKPFARLHAKRAALRQKEFNIKRDKGGKGFSMTIGKKIKGFEEETEMPKEEQDEITNEEGGEQEVMEPTVSDLVTHAIDQKPLDFQKTFNDLMQSRIEDAVQDRKLELAAEFAGANTNPSELEDEAKPEDDEEDADEDNEGHAVEVDDPDPEVTKEETKQLDELSPYVLKRFVKKAATDIGKRAFNVGLKGGADKPEAKQDAAKAEKHAKYIPKAVHRIQGKYYPSYVRQRNPNYGGSRKYEGSSHGEKLYKPKEGSSFPPSAKSGERERFPRKAGRLGKHRANEEVNQVDNQQLDEKWGKENVVNPAEKGKYKGRTLASLKSAYHKPGTDKRELAFAIRAKTNWGKVNA